MIKEPDYKKAELLFYYGGKDSAFYYFNEFVNHSRDSLQIAMSYSYMASMQSDAGDYFGSQESLLSSLRYLNEKREKDYYCLASNYNELGLTSLNLNQYDAAIHYCDLALPLAQEEKFKLVVLNNKAVALQKKQQYNSAVRIYDSLLTLIPPQTKEYARVLSNLAKARWLKNRDYNAIPELWAALQIRKSIKDDWGENASYAHLADYYFHSQPDSALFYSRQMYAVASQLKSPDDQLEALQKLIKLAPAKTTKQYFEQYQHLNDSLQNARNAAKNQFAVIRYEAEKHKADNLELQKQNTEKQSQIIRQRLILLFVSIISILAVTFFILWSRKNKQQILLKTEHDIRENQLRISQKVHDVVANGLYRLMTEVQYKEDLTKDHLLDKIEDMYERSRDISYEKEEGGHNDFHDELKKLLKSFETEATHVLIAGNTQALWHNTSLQTRREVKYILQELIVNMKKHSSASNVALKFEQGNNQIQIQYTDDGIGLPAQFRKGNGLHNTGNRITAIGGKISFDSKTVKGLRILISFPTR